MRKQKINNEAKQYIFSMFIIILLIVSVLSSIFGFPVSRVSAIDAPSVQTNNATGVEEMNITLRGSLINDGGENCNVSFEYNTTTSYGIQTPSQGTLFDSYLIGEEKWQRGLTTDGTFIYIVNVDSEYVFVYNMDGTYTGTSWSSSASFPNGITTYGDYLYILDRDNNRIIRSNKDGSGKINIPLGSIAYDSIATDGNYFWFGDSDDSEVYKYEMDGTYTGEHFDTYSNGRYPQGLTTDGEYIWVISAGADENAYRYTMDGTYTGETFSISAGGIEGGSIYNNRLYVLDGGFGTETIYVYNIGVAPHPANTGDNFNYTLFNLSVGTLYHYRAIANNSVGETYGSDVVFLTKPNQTTNLLVDNSYAPSILNLTWTKGDGANNTYIERNTTSSWSRGNGTLVYNDTTTYYNDTGLDMEIQYYYQAWSYTNWTDNSTTYYQYSDSYVSNSNTTNDIDPPSNGSSTYDEPYVNLTWSRGSRSDREIVVQNNNTYPTSHTDGWIRQNDTITYFNESITYVTYFTVWSYNSTSELYSSTGLDIPWGALIINCYDEETNDSLWFDVSISNQDGSQSYERTNNTNPHYLDISQLPTGDDIKITVSAASNYSEKSEVSYWGVDENYTITYIVLSQTADSKSTTNVTCINTSDGAHSYPPFTLDEDLITILPDDADNFTKIFVNYTHEEYSSRLYYRDISESGFSILNAYLPPTEDKQLYLLEVIDEASNTVSDAHIEVKRSVNGTYVIVSRLLTDANGQADLNLISNRNYIFIISKEGYVTENASWTPGTDIFTHTFKILLETTPIEPDTFGDIISFYGTLYVNNTLRVTFYDLDDATADSHFLVYENYNGTLTYMGEYNGTTENNITFWINVDNATRLHIIVLYMNHSTLGEVINYRIFVYPVHIDREGGTWLEDLIVSVVGEFDYGYVITLIWVLPCVLLVAGLASIGHPGTGILGAGLYSFWITWNITLPEEAKILTFASIAIVVGFITIFLVKGKKVVH